MIREYLWPRPPMSISQESRKAMTADLEDKGMWSADLGDRHRCKVDVWIRHTDNQARAANMAWFQVHGAKFVRRWAVLSLLAWGGAIAASGNLWLEVPLTLIGVGSGCVSMFWLWLRNQK